MNEILNSCRTIPGTIFCQPIDIRLFMAYYDQYVDKENGNMESMLPNGYVTSPAKLYGNYKNIREVTVRLFRDTEIQYYLLTGSEYCGDRKKVSAYFASNPSTGSLTRANTCTTWRRAASARRASSPRFSKTPSHRAVSLRCSRICSAEAVTVICRFPAAEPLLPDRLRRVVGRKRIS